MLQDAKRAALDWPIEQTPDPGATMAVADGIHWLRMPLPFALEHINLWLLDEGSGWCIVDTGVDNAESREIWQRVVADRLDDAPITRVLLTHMHPDHSGCAGWLCQAHGTELWMTREEYLLCRVLTADTGHPAPQKAIDFYHAAGFPPEAMERYEQMFGMFGRLVSELPVSFIRMSEGGRLDIGDSCWDILIGRGHSPEHACLFDANRNVLISGDQILPTISSNVSVFPTEPLANPLDHWLVSLRRLREQLPHDVLVLPAHGRPFTGVHTRLDQLIDEHESGLDALLDLCGTPRRVVDVFPALFRAPIRGSNLVMATGESIAHLNYLLLQGELEKTSDPEGVDWYSKRGS